MFQVPRDRIVKVIPNVPDFIVKILHEFVRNGGHWDASREGFFIFYTHYLLVRLKNTLLVSDSADVRSGMREVTEGACLSKTPRSAQLTWAMSV